MSKITNKYYIIKREIEKDGEHVLSYVQQPELSVHTIYACYPMDAFRLSSYDAAKSLIKTLGGEGMSILCAEVSFEKAKLPVKERYPNVKYFIYLGLGYADFENGDVLTFDKQGVDNILIFTTQKNVRVAINESAVRPLHPDYQP